MAHQLAEAHPDLATALYLVNKWIRKRIHDTHQPGLAVGIVYDGELLWGEAYGQADVADGTSLTLDTRFRIASITKTFTAVAMLQLYEQGKLRFDDPVSNYLDWFNLHYADAPPITLYHLLTHTSGLPRDATVPHWTEDRFQTWAELVETTQEREPVAPPLQRFGYSNLGYSLLGGVIEVVSGQPWDDYVQAHILEPLDMRDTIPTPMGDEPNLATGYLRYDDAYERAAAPFVETKGFSASASFASSVNDLVKYARLHLGKEPFLLSDYSLRDMHRPHWVNEDWQGGYGLGSDISRVNGVTLSGHTGGYKGYLTAFSLCREHSVGVIVLSNSINSDPFGYVEHIYKWVLPEVLKATGKDKPEPDVAWQRYTGTYKGDWGKVMVVIRNKQLEMISLDDMDMPSAVLEPTGEAHTFKCYERGNPVETVRFELGDDGSVVRLWNRSEYLRREDD